MKFEAMQRQSEEEMSFTDNDLKRLKEQLKQECSCSGPYEDCIHRDELNIKALIESYSLALKVVRAVQKLQGHPAFCGDTRSYAGTDSSAYAGIEDIRKALAPFSQGEKENR